MNQPQSLLQRFFDASLIPSETTDERLKHYQVAAADLADRFGKTPRDAVSASRVAIDPNCRATEPWFEVVQEAVKVHWKTFLVKNYDAPRQICRAILLEALCKAADESSTATLAIWNACSSLLPHLGDGPEQVITREFITGLGGKCEIHASLEWHLETTPAENLPELEFKLPAMNAVQIDEAELTNGFSDAAGPTDAQGKNHGNQNPHWTNAAPQWSYQFAPRAAKAVSSTVNKAFAATSPVIKAMRDKLPAALKEHANALAKWVVGSAQRNERFTALLWWKEALYSPSLQRSYRDLSPTGAAIALSYDLGGVSGAPVPLSVEYFLRETIRCVLPANSKLSLAELVQATMTDDEVVPCLPIAPNGFTHRVSLREFLSLVRRAVPPDETISGLLGVVASTSLPISEWAVWLLRERIAEILIASDA